MAEKWLLRVYAVNAEKADPKGISGVVEGDPFGVVTFMIPGEGYLGRVATIFTKERLSE